MTSGGKNSIFRGRQGTPHQISPKNSGVLLKTQVHQSQGDRVILDFKRASFNGPAQAYGRKLESSKVPSTSSNPFMATIKTPTKARLDEEGEKMELNYANPNRNSLSGKKSTDEKMMGSGKKPPTS